MQSCIICLEEANDLTIINHCGVYYVHKQCYKKWKTKNNTCIVCREPLTQEDTITVQQQQQQQQQQHAITIQHELSAGSNYNIIFTLQFKVIYTICVIIITLTAVYIMLVW